MTQVEMLEKYQGVFEFVNTHLVMRMRLATHKRIGVLCDGSVGVDVILDYIQRIGGYEIVVTIGDGLDEQQIENVVSENELSIVMTPAMRDRDGLPDEMTCFTPSRDERMYDEYRPMFFWSEEHLKMYEEMFLSGKE